MSWDIVYKDNAALLNEFFGVSSVYLVQRMSWDIVYKDVVLLLNEFSGDFQFTCLKKCFGTFSRMASLLNYFFGESWKIITMKIWTDGKYLL